MMLYHVISSYIMLYHVISCYIMLYHVISCYIMLYHVISCDTIYSLHFRESLRVTNYQKATPLDNVHYPQAQQIAISPVKKKGIWTQKNLEFTISTRLAEIYLFG